MPTTASIETARLTLRSFQADDLEPLYQIQWDGEAMRYTFHTPSRAESAVRLRAYAAQTEQIGLAPWTVLLRAEAKIIGWGGLNIDPFDPGWGVEVAYFFAPAYWGRGLATELVQASVEEGFGRHGLGEINAFVHRENCASARVLEKCGFRFRRFEPRLERNHYVIDGHPHR
jgi:ribosomal-protein-alanine N-acetyltransferase